MRACARSRRIIADNDGMLCRARYRAKALRNDIAKPNHRHVIRGTHATRTYEMKRDKSQRGVAQSASFIFKLLRVSSSRRDERISRSAIHHLQRQPNDVSRRFVLPLRFYVVYVGILFNFCCHCTAGRRALSVMSRRKAPGATTNFSKGA